MSLSLLLHAIEIDLPRYTRAYGPARSASPYLASYKTPADVLRALLPATSTMSDAGRKALVNRLVEEAQKPSASPLWPSLLALNFAPMLHELRHQMGEPKNADFDSALMLAFFAAVRTTRIEASFAEPLYRAVAREVRPIARADLPPEAFESFDENRHGTDIFGVAARAREIESGDRTQRRIALSGPARPSVTSPRNPSPTPKASCRNPSPVEPS